MLDEISKRHGYRLAWTTSHRLSSFAYLRRLAHRPKIKIDPPVRRDIGNSAQAEPIISAMAGPLAQKLALDVAGEGVETPRRCAPLQAPGLRLQQATFSRGACPPPSSPPGRSDITPAQARCRLKPWVSLCRVARPEENSPSPSARGVGFEGRSVN